MFYFLKIKRALEAVDDAGALCILLAWLSSTTLIITEIDMIKLALLLTLATGTAFYAGGRTVYSGLQAQLFPGTSLKMAPDPSNIWSFHETVTLLANKKLSVPVLVDFDNNKKMDTELSFARVLITDMQVTFLQPGGIQTANLQDDKGIRWNLRPVVADRTSRRNVSYHLTTPLALPISSGLKIVLKSINSPTTVTINLIGRLVSM